ncbi:MAG: hypothetical protein CMH25_01905 [Micavibrio sp.]|nr:hypothetical protein [Micavibrio sp.]|tara:strand:- start:373922 stop:374461 length:540 start_codon:yes stop_codon:yes gene_type:complete
MRYTLTLLLTSFVLVFSPLAMAQDKVASAEIVIVDMDQLENSSDAAEKLKAKLKSKREDFKAVILKEEAKLRETEQALLKKREKLEPEEFQKEVQAFEKELIEARKDIQKKKADFEQTVSKALGKLRSEIVRIVGNMASENNYKLVLDRRNVVIVDKDYDITAKVLKEMNKSVKDISIN